MSHPDQVAYCQLTKARFPLSFKNKDVLDVWSLDINGNNRYLFDDCTYTGIDLWEGKNVDIVCSAHEFHPGKQYDTIISTEMLEHNKDWKDSLWNMYKLLVSGWLMIITCAWEWRPEHWTTRTSPADAPFTNSYYMNIEAGDLREAFNPDSDFSYYEISKLGTDFRFVGVKI